MISQLLPGEKRMLALRWSAYDPKSAGNPLLDIDAAANWQDFRAALEQMVGAFAERCVCRRPGAYRIPGGGVYSLSAAGNFGRADCG